MILEGNQMGSGPLGFLANLNCQQIWYAFINYRLSWARLAILLSMVSYREFLLDLKVNIFLYLWPFEGIRF